jgi:cyanophycinase
MGYILLAGGAEFGGEMEAADRQAIALAGGPDASLSIIPAAAAPQNDHWNAGQNGVDWFKSLGAVNVAALPLIDSASANSPRLVDILRRSRLIYILGGSPNYLSKTLTGSDSWQAMLAAYKAGAVIGGSSAGAMVLCEHYYDPSQGEVFEGLGLVPGCCLLPHHDTFGHGWARQLRKLLPHTTLIGIDERTAMLNNAVQGGWQVYGQGVVTVYKGTSRECFAPGQPVDLTKCSLS